MLKIVMFRILGDILPEIAELYPNMNWNIFGLHQERGANGEAFASKPMATTQKEFFIFEQMLLRHAGNRNHLIQDITSEYSLIRTRAPRAYDYDYVIEIGRMDGEFGEERILAVPNKHKDYQSARYSSGLYTPINCG